MYPDQKTYELQRSIITQGDTGTASVVEVSMDEIWKNQRTTLDRDLVVRVQVCNDGVYADSTNATIAPTTGYGTEVTEHTANKDYTWHTPVGAQATETLTISGVVIDGEKATVNGRDYYFSSGRTTVPTGDVTVDISGDGTKSAGTLTVIDAPTATDTMTIGSTVYTFVAAQAVAGDIAVGAAAVAEVTDITCVADVSDSLDGLYFLLGDTAGTVGVWIDTSGGAATIPTTGADRDITLGASVTTNDTATAVATAVAARIDLDSQFGATSSGAVVTVTNAEDGDFTAAADGDSTFTFAITTAGVDATAQDNIVAAVNGTDDYNDANAEASIAAFVDNDAVITALYTGTQGDSIVTTETFTAAASVFDAATLGTTTAGVDVAATDAGDAFDVAVAADTEAVITSSNSAGTVTITSKSYGTSSNAYTTTETMANGAFGAGTMSGGAYNGNGVIRFNVTDATAETVTLRFGMAAVSGVPADYAEKSLQLTHPSA